MTHALAFSQAVEGLTGSVVPDRARWGRVLLAELERAYNHVGDLGNICAGMGFNKNVFETSAKDFRRVLELNVVATFMVGRAAARIMLARLAQGKREAYEDFDQGARLERQGRPDSAAVAAALERVQGQVRWVLNAARTRPARNSAK